MWNLFIKRHCKYKLMIVTRAKSWKYVWNWSGEGNRDMAPPPQDWCDSIASHARTFVRFRSKDVLWIGKTGPNWVLCESYRFIITLQAEKSLSESCLIYTNLDCNYTFSIDLAPNGFPFVPNQLEKCNHNLNSV